MDRAIVDKCVMKYRFVPAKRDNSLDDGMAQNLSGRIYSIGCIELVGIVSVRSRADGTDVVDGAIIDVGMTTGEDANHFASGVNSRGAAIVPRTYIVNSAIIDKDATCAVCGVR